MRGGAVACDELLPRCLIHAGWEIPGRRIERWYHDTILTLGRLPVKRSETEGFGVAALRRGSSVC
jgi:hypothetical protein